MLIPEFLRDNLNPRLVQEDLGEAFQRFVHELLTPEYPDLHLFPSTGKDGAIDLSQTSQTSRTAIETKHLSKKALVYAQRTWRDVAKKLREHLADPSGPTMGQAQYRPWYRTDPPIQEYLFCISSTLANQEQKDKLREEICNLFAQLSSEYQHLAHLGTLAVQVIDWNDCCSRLRQQPHVAFRWFPAIRPHGIVPLDDVPYEGTFRSYLTSSKLPYYSHTQYLQVRPAPPELGVLDEEALLAQIERGDVTGLLFTGSGGIGKTRLTLEIGHLAQRKGWFVLRVLARLRENALFELAASLSPSIPVLLVLDYVETQRECAELLETLNELNDTFYLRLRFVASCRTSYYQSVAAISRHKRVNLSPQAEESAAAWLREYRHQIVRHILEHSGLQVTDKHLSICRDIPILAVFLSYLYSEGRQLELSELLSEADFGTWVAKRVQLSFGQMPIDRELALLAAQFPLPVTSVPQLNPQTQAPVLDRLAADGWIEKVSADGSRDADVWVTAHDVLADEIVLSYMKSVPQTVEHFVDDLFTSACRTNCLDSALFTLQRLIDYPVLRSVDWPEILDRKMVEECAAWRCVRDLLIRTSLLTAAQIIELLREHEDFWEGAEKETDFQNALGWLCRWAVIQEKSSLDSLSQSTLVHWVKKCVPYPVRSNYILTWGLRLCPEAVRIPARQWILTRPTLFQTHYLIVAWLESGLPLLEIASAVVQWVEKFRTDPHLTFVAKAWLDAEGDKTLVQEPIEEWLKEHRTNLDAEFVYQAWLDAEGDKTLVQEPIAEWLKEHKTNLDAQFVYRAWLDAEGDKTLVQKPIEEWLKEHRTKLEAGFVYRAWLDAEGDKTLVQKPIEEWLKEHRTNLDAGFVYQAWLDAEGDKTLVQEPIAEWLKEHRTNLDAGFVYRAWLAAEGDKTLVQKPIAEWLKEHKTNLDAKFVYRAWFDAKGDKELVQQPMESWLREHAAAPDAGFVLKGWLNARGDVGVVRNFVETWLEGNNTELDAQFVYRAWLEAGGDKGIVQQPLEGWLREHATAPEAGFVLKGWLDTGYGPNMVENALIVWLSKHGTDADADFVYKAWLAAGGAFSVVKSPAITWMHQNHEKWAACYVTKFLAKQPDLSDETVTDILTWCRNFCKDSDALWRLRQLGVHLLREEVAEEVCTTSEAVLTPLISGNAPLRPQVVGLITNVFSYLIDAPKLKWTNLRSRVDALLLIWLRNPFSFPISSGPHITVQRASFVERIGDFIAAGAIDVMTDREPLRRFLTWVNTWSGDRKLSVYTTLVSLRQKYPVSDLWDIVDFD